MTEPASASEDSGWENVNKSVWHGPQVVHGSADSSEDFSLESIHKFFVMPE